jgi:hypothetical protein
MRNVYFSSINFGAIVKGTNSTKACQSKKWQAVGNGWHKVTQEGETHLWVTDAESKGELRWLNLATFSGEVVSLTGKRTIYYQGKVIESTSFTFPVVTDYKKIVRNYEASQGLTKPLTASITPELSSISPEEIRQCILSVANKAYPQG